MDDFNGYPGNQLFRTGIAHLFSTVALLDIHGLLTNLYTPAVGLPCMVNNIARANISSGLYGVKK